MNDNQEHLQKLKATEKEFKEGAAKEIKKKESQQRHPSCLVEFIIALALITITLFGVINILADYLANAFNSVFGMGLK